MGIGREGTALAYQTFEEDQALGATLTLITPGWRGHGSLDCGDTEVRADRGIHGTASVLGFSADLWHLWPQVLRPRGRRSESNDSGRPVFRKFGGH